MEAIKKEDSLIFSDDQQGALDTWSRFLVSDESYASLIGPAGSGKSTLVKEMLSIVGRFQTVHLSAPTHKAAGNLRHITDNEVRTIHSMMCMTVERDMETGKEYLKHNKDRFSPEEYAGSVILVDEAGMVGKDLLEQIQSVPNCKVLFVGDAAQLPPVGEELSVAVDPKICPWTVAELTKVHRQALDNPIIALATRIRESVDGVYDIRQELNGDQGVHILEPRAWEDQAINECMDPESMNRVISYTNNYSTNFNAAIREERYGKDAPQYMEGELMVANSRIAKGKKSIIDNNDDVIIREVSPDPESSEFLELTVQRVIQGDSVKVRVMAKMGDREKHLTKIANMIKRKVKGYSWRQYYAAKDGIADLRPVYSGTTHKAQGSTYHDVYIDLREMFQCHEKDLQRRLLYVAVTRASNSVYLTL